MSYPRLPKPGEKFPTSLEYFQERLKIFHQEPPRLKGIARFGEAGRIHPLYKFCRWGALLAGITYGFSRSKFLQRRADKYKEVRHKKLAERLAREAEQKVENEKANIRELEKITGAKFY